MYHIFTIEGIPQGKERARTVRDAYGNVRTYTPSKTRNYEKQVALAYGYGLRFLDKPVSITILAVFPIPKSYSKKRKELCLSGAELPKTKPDLDNIAKAILDGLNGIAYNDDKQVAQLCVTKRYGNQPFVKVYVEDFNPCDLTI